MDFTSQLSQLVQEIEATPSLISNLTEEQIDNLTEEQITKLRKATNPYAVSLGNTNGIVCTSIINVRDDYIRKFHTTALVGYLYRAWSEYNTDEFSSTVFVRRVRPGSNMNDFTQEDLNTVARFYLNTSKEIVASNGEAFNKMLKNYRNGEEVIITDVNELFVDTDDKSKMCIFEESDGQYNFRKDLLQYELTRENDLKRTHIKDFLDSMFEYNPDIHVRRARENLSTKNKFEEQDYMRNVTWDVISHSSNASSGEIVNPTTGKSATAEEIAAVTASVENQEILDANSELPLDMLARYKFYCDVNFEEIRKTVSVLYSVQPDVEYSINPYVFYTDDAAGENSKTAQQKAEEFISKNQKDVITDIVSLTSGKWNLLGAFRENRRRINFLNDNTSVIEDIFKQVEVDAKLGEDLMKKRVIIKKRENNKREGPVHPNFLRYTKENMPAVNKMGAEHIDDATVIASDERNRSAPVVTNSSIPEVEENESIEVGVISMNAKDGTVKKSMFHSRAEKPTK
jgi:hypothetical protein